MGWFEDLFSNPWISPAGYLASGIVSDVKKIQDYDTELDQAEKAKIARRQLAYLGLGTLSLIAASPLYAYSLRKRTLKPREERIGVSLENSSVLGANLLISAFAAPAISTAAAYILVQKLEDAQLISKNLGNAAQGLMTVAAAGPAIGAITGTLTSAFRKGK